MKHIFSLPMFAAILLLLATAPAHAVLPYNSSDRTILKPWELSAFKPVTGLKKATVPVQGDENFVTELPKFKSLPKPLPVKKAIFDATEAPVWMYGNVTSTHEPLDEPLIGIYRYQLNSSDHHRERVHIDMQLRGLWGNAAWTPEGYHIATINEDGWTHVHKLYDLDTWEILRSYPRDLRYYQFSSSAWDWRENKSAALCFSDYNWAIYDFCHFLNTTDFDRTEGFPVVMPSSLFRAIAVDTDGASYGIDYNGILWFIDRHNNRVRMVGNTGCPSPYDTSMYMDPLTHTLYYVCNNQKTTLYKVDTETAQATFVWDFPWNEQIYGLYTLQPLALDAAPAAVENLETDFGGSLTGTVGFKAPSLTYGGAPLTGNLQYEVRLDRRTVSTGTVVPGATASTQITADTIGWHTVNVFVKNQAGQSPYNARDLWIGRDKVVNVVAPVLEYTGGNQMRIKWDACTDPQNGGYINPADVRYDVMKLPEMTPVASGTTESECTDIIVVNEGQPNAYQYAVRAYIGSDESDFVYTNKIFIGHAVPPYDFKMATEKDALLFTAVDADNDGYTWKWHNGRMVAYYNNGTLDDRDDWLVGAPLLVDAGKTYKLTFSLSGHNGAYEPHNFSVWGGTAPDPEHLTDVLHPVTELENTPYNPERFDVAVTPSQSGTYYVAIRTTAHPLAYYLYLFDMSISGGETSAAPAKIEDFTVYQHETGGAKAFIGMTAPTSSVGGEPLESIDYISVLRDGTEIFRKENPAPGERIEYVETLRRTGEYDYSAFAANASGIGETAHVHAIIGFTTPEMIPWGEGAHCGEGAIRFNWTLPAVNQSGSPINPAMLTTRLYDSDGVLLAENIRGTTYDLLADNPALDHKQEYHRVRLQSVMPGGASDRLFLTNPVPLGRPFALPFTESFPDATAGTPWVYEKLAGYARFWLADDESGIGSSDNDNGFVVYQSNEEGAEARFTGPVVKMSENHNALSLALFCQEGNHNEVEIQINDGEWHTVQKVLCDSGIPGEWNEITAELPSEYSGQKLQVGILCRTVNSVYSYIDNLRIEPSSSVPGRFNPESDSFSVKTSSHCLEVIPGNEPVSIYTSTGILVNCIHEHTRLQLAAGVYILTSGSQSVKVRI